jgi:predicted HicB family RNase H-like nuclease
MDQPRDDSQQRGPAPGSAQPSMITLRISRALHARVADGARARRTSMNAMLTAFVVERLDEDDRRAAAGVMVGGNSG